MASNSSSAAAGTAFAEEISELMVDNYIAVAVTALALYEFMITIEEEIKVGWQRRVTATSLLMISTRWVMVLLEVTQWAAGSPKSCAWMQIVFQVFTTISMAQVTVFSALRIFALWNSNYLLAIVILILGSMPIGYSIFVTIRSSYGWIGAPYSLCNQSLLFPDSDWPKLEYANRTSQIAVDTLVLVLTWIKTYGQWRLSRRLNITAPLSAYLLRDGTLYFLVLLVLNIAQMITFDLTPNEPIGVLLSVAPAILISRFITNLRQIGDSGGLTPHTYSSQELNDTISGPRFAVQSRFLGNIGESLDYARSDAVDREDGDEFQD